MRIRFYILALCLALCALAIPALAEECPPVDAPVPEEEFVLGEPAAPEDTQVDAVEAVPKASPAVTEIKITNPVEDEYAFFMPFTMVMQKESTKFQVKTNTAAKYLFLLNSSGKKLKTWSYSKYSKTRTDSSGNKYRLWSVAYAFKTAKTMTISFGAGAKSTQTPKGKQSMTIEVLKLPVIKSLKCTPTKADIGEAISFKLKCSEEGQYLRLIDEEGNAIETYDVFRTQNDDGSHTVEGKFSLEKGGTQSVTFRVGYTKDRGFAKKSVKIKVTDSAIHSARFTKSTVQAGNKAQAEVVTGTDVAVIGLFNEKNQLLDSWDARDCATVEEDRLTWTVKTSFQRLGKRKLSFRARTSALGPYMGDDADQFGPARNVSVTVKGKSVVDVESVHCAMAKLNSSNWFDYQHYMVGGMRDDYCLASVDMLMLSVYAPENTKYIHVYNENGEQIIRKKVSDKTMHYEEYESKRDWYVPIYLMKDRTVWGNTFTVKASVDGKKVGKGKKFTIDAIGPVALEPGKSVEMYISAVNYPEESMTAVSLKAPKEGNYAIKVDYPKTLHYYLYHAGSNVILREGLAEENALGQEVIHLEASEGETFVLRLDFQGCSGTEAEVRCDYN